MKRCADCGSEAVWLFDDPGAKAVSYCDDHLPVMLRPRAANGSLTRIERPARKTAAKG